MKSLLEVDRLNAFYGASQVLRDVSLQVGQGETVALLGRNGVGKSTTLKALMGLIKTRSRMVRFNGVDISSYPTHRIARAGVGYVPEERRVFGNLSVLDNLQLGALARATKEPKTWSLEKVLKTFPALEERARHPGAHLSGGEQQMLAIGRALMSNPLLLMVDEPTEGLAPLVVQRVQQVLAELNKAGLSILLVEQNLAVAASLASRMYVMVKGRIVYSGHISDLESRPEIRTSYLEV